MTFSEFVNMLFPIIGAGSSTHAFTRSMFDTILDESGQSILDEYSEETYKAYYNGSTGISRIAKKVCAYMEPENFSSYIDEFPDATRDSLCEVFKASISDCDSYNISQALANSTGVSAAIMRTSWSDFMILLILAIGRSLCFLKSFLSLTTTENSGLKPIAKLPEG